MDTAEKIYRQAEKTDNLTKNIIQDQINTYKNMIRFIEVNTKNIRSFFDQFDADFTLNKILPNLKANLRDTERKLITFKVQQTL